MAIIELDSKAFKATISQSKKLAEQSGARRQTILIRGDRPEMVAINDHNQFHTYLKGIIHGPGDGLYINPDSLISLKPRSKTLRLEWQDKAQLSIQDGNTKYSLRLGVAEAAIADPNVSAVNATVSGSVLDQIQAAVSLPYAFHRQNSDKMPVHLVSENGRLVVRATDGYTVVNAETNINYLGESIKIPIYLLEIFSGDPSDIQLSPDNFQLQIVSSNRRLIASTLDERDLDFNSILDNLNGTLVSFDFDPQILLQEISPLTDMLDSKEKTGAILVLLASAQGFSLHLNHKELGRIDNEKLESVSNPYLERGLSKATINMHPNAFLEFTKLVANLKVKTAKAYCTDRAVYYDVAVPWGRVRYIFPTVQV